MHGTKYFIVVGWNRKVTIFVDDMYADKTYPYCVYPGKGAPAMHSDDILTMAFMEPNILATASFDGGIVLSNIQSGHVLKKLRWPDQETAVINKSIETVIFLKERASNLQSADLLTTGGDGIIRWWRTSEAELMWELNGVKGREGESIYTMVTNPSNSILITGDSLGWITIYNIKETCIDGREQVSVPPVLVQFRAHLRCISSIDVFEKTLLTASTDGTARLFTHLGEFIGTFGQDQVWDINEPCTPPIPSDVLQAIEAEGKKTDKSHHSKAHQKFRRASLLIMDNVEEAKERIEINEIVGRAAAASLTSATSKSSLADDFEDSRDKFLSLSNFSPRAPSSAGSSSQGDSISALESTDSLAPEKPLPLPRTTARKSSILNLPSSKKPSDQQRRPSGISSFDKETVPWRNRALRTPELVQTNYRTWYGKSQYAKSYLEQEKRKGGRRKPNAGGGSLAAEDTGKLPNISALAGGISLAYHSLHPSRVQDFSDHIHLVAALPAVATLISRTKAENRAGISLKEDGGATSNGRNKSALEMTSKSAFSSDQDGATHGGISKTLTTTRVGGRKMRLTTPAIREIIDNDSDNKKQAIQDYLFG
ncbi:WD40 repeat domain 95 [Podochytrium sp. JEL0797]|nr:WD40 repeat domain 95 [Podochytrium sp. JEL0797]